MRWLLVALMCALLVPLVHAEILTVQLNETGKITEYLNTYWVVNVNGTGTIENPSDRDLYDVRLHFDILGLDLIDTGGTGYFEGTSLTFDHLPGESRGTFSYKIVGITAEPPTLKGKGVLYTGLAKKTPRIYSDVFGELKKGSLEDPAFTGRSGRLVSVTLQNPTGFQFTIEEMRVIKTPSLNPNQITDQWAVVNSTSPRILDPDGFFVHDILDKSSAEGEVYWLESDVYISNVDLRDANSILRLTEVNLTVPVELLNFTNTTNMSSPDYLRTAYMLRKEISDRVAVPGEPMTVTLMLHNLGPSLARFSLEDTMPSGFTAGRELSWEGEIAAHGTTAVRYDVVLNDTTTAGIDAFPPAEALIAGQRVYSQEVPFIRQFIPEERLYVQKRITYRSDDRVDVRVEVQNLGRSSVKGATLKEFLSDDDLFSEISQTPDSKGVWKIPDIPSGESWEVSYVTEQGSSVATLPMVYGVPANTVLRSLVLENVVSEAWHFVRTNLIELLGICVLFAIPLLLYMGKKHSWWG